MNWRRAWRRRLLKKSNYRIESSWQRLKKTRDISHLSRLVFYGFLVLVFFSIVLFVYFAKDLPRPDRVVRQEGFSTKIYDRNEQPLYDVFANQRRTPVKLADVPLYFRQATVAIEDKNFYKHHGFDFTGILRAAYNIVVHQRLQGGSTLTQQLVKNALLTSQRTIPRKIKEFILSVQIESRYSKDEILQMYLNETPYGGTAWGVEAATETYFGKKVSDLNLVESAILAGLPQRPSAYSPFGDDPQAYIGRTETVLRRMREDGYITADQEKEATDFLPKVQFAAEGISFKAPHFVMYVKHLLEDRYGTNLVEQGGLQVYTSLDLDIQEEAQKIMAEEISKVEKLKIGNGAAIVLDPQTGEILAMVGSKNYNDPNYDGKVNVTLSLRQPGSAIKPVTYVTAFKKGYTPATMIMDTATTFPVTGQPNYEPNNYDGKWHGPLQIRYALGNSINITAVKMLAAIGIKDMLTTAYDMGLTTLEPTVDNLRRFGLSITLGGGEIRLLDMAAAYSTFANGGLRTDPVSILKVVDQNGKVLDEYKPIAGRRVLTHQQAFLISNILSDNNARTMTFGANSSLNIPGRTVAAKTGTTNDKRDNWTIGWTPQIIAGVWVGNNDNSPMKEIASGVSGAAPIWRRIIIAALAKKPAVDFPVPEGIVTADVDQISGFRVHDGFSSRPEYFIAGTEPNGPDPVHLKLKLCPGQNKLATAAQISRGQYEEKEFFVFKENDPVSTDGVNRWQQGIDQWLVGQGDSRYHPPTEYCGDVNEMEINFEKPSDQSQVNSNDVEIKGKVVAPNKVISIEIYVDGVLKDGVENSSGFDKIVFINTGVHTIKIKARDEKGSQKEREIKIGVNVPWNWTPSPTPAPTSTPTPSPSPMPTPTPAPTFPPATPTPH